MEFARDVHSTLLFLWQLSAKPTKPENNKRLLMNQSFNDLFKAYAHPSLAVPCSYMLTTALSYSTCLKSPLSRHVVVI